MKRLDKKEVPLSFSEYVTKHAPKTWEFDNYTKTIRINTNNTNNIQ